ncbi:hypothetical protein V6N11_079228 [Hibiscus sabdariffa]|uniref:F-box associated beta-propeller type 3 domain-containing protein n=1 Tax=Hibiscus sabdariffa TaxID=183260 RepID=A0ABR2RVG3_9ROSI
MNGGNDFFDFVGIQSPVSVSVPLSVNCGRNMAFSGFSQQEYPQMYLGCSDALVSPHGLIIGMVQWDLHGRERSTIDFQWDLHGCHNRFRFANSIWSRKLNICRYLRHIVCHEEVVSEADDEEESNASRYEREEWRGFVASGNREMSSLDLNCLQMEPHGALVRTGLMSYGSYDESLVCSTKGLISTGEQLSSLLLRKETMMLAVNRERRPQFRDVKPDIVLVNGVVTYHFCRVVLDGYSAPLTTGNFAKLLIYKLHFPTTLPLSSSGARKRAKQCSLYTLTVMGLISSSSFNPLRLSPVVGSCNGLICVQLFYYGEYDLSFLLWNPSIQKYISLPQMKFSKIVFLNVGFGFDSRTNDYKLLTFGVDKYGSRIEPSLFSLNGNCWKSVTAVYPSYGFVPQMSLPFVNGTVHWLGYQEKNDGGYSRAILGFDLCAEEFFEIKLPESLFGLSHVDKEVPFYQFAFVYLSCNPSVHARMCTHLSMLIYTNSGMSIP